MKKDNRRKFIQKLGVTVGATALLNTESIASVANMRTGKDIERAEFLNNYEIWVNQYINVIEKEKSDKNNMVACPKFGRALSSDISRITH